MQEKERISTASILGKQVLQVCHNLRSPVSQFVTAAVLGEQLSSDHPDIQKIFRIINNAARLLAESITVMERRTAYEEGIAPERIDLVPFIQDQLLFFEYDERMKYKTECTFHRTQEEVHVLVVPSDLSLLIANLLDSLLRRLDHALKSSLHLSIDVGIDSVDLSFAQVCDWLADISSKKIPDREDLRFSLQSILEENRLTLNMNDNDETGERIITVHFPRIDESQNT